MKKINEVKNEPKTQNCSPSGGYVLIDEIESYIHLTMRMRIIRHFVEFYARLSTHKSLCTHKTVRIFIASGDRIDTKIDSINKRLKKK